jgi:hypothetical protein
MEDLEHGNHVGGRVLSMNRGTVVVSYGEAKIAKLMES